MSAVPVSGGKRAYRYLIETSAGCLAEQAPPGTHVIDWTYFGRGHCWTVFNFKTGKETGSMYGIYVDKGFKTADGKYVTDAEAASATATASKRSRPKKQSAARQETP